MEWGKDPSFWIYQPFYIKQLVCDVAASKQISGFFVDLKGKVFQKVSICGYIATVEQKYKHCLMTIDDSTGFFMQVFMFENQQEQFFPDTTNLTIGKLVIVNGKLNAYRESKNIIANKIKILEDINEEILWNLQTLLIKSRE